MPAARNTGAPDRHDRHWSTPRASRRRLRPTLARVAAAAVDARRTEQRATQRERTRVVEGQVGRRMRRDAEARAPPAMPRHVRRDVSPAPLPPLGSVVGRVVHRSTEAAVAGDAAGAVGGGHPADQAERGPCHSRRFLALGDAAQLHGRSRQDVTGSTTIQLEDDWRQSWRARRSATRIPLPARTVDPAAQVRMARVETGVGSGR